ncbi:MAG: AgmX/PglI C-terminal domain-containing protein [Deltaproteobacteria bacterium]|nr:AgmX/PglI C-terminal domain-containing protein [Deltaproteobacteria bacterium]
MTDKPPPPSSNSKYGIIGAALLLGGLLAIYMSTRGSPPETPQTAVDAGRPAPPPPPPTPTIGEQIELPPPEVDAGPPPDVPRHTVRTVYRYVGGCTGTIDNGAAQSVAQANFGGLRACYEAALRSNNALRGNLTARLIINTSGRVDDVAVSTGMNNPAMIQCMKSRLRAISFPAARGGCVEFHARYTFAPRE